MRTVLRLSIVASTIVAALIGSTPRAWAQG
jgi:hypothetical protein